MIGWLILWTVFVFALGMVLQHALLEYNKTRKPKETEFRLLNRRAR